MSRKRRYVPAAFGLTFYLDIGETLGNPLRDMRLLPLLGALALAAAPLSAAPSPYRDNYYRQVCGFTNAGEVTDCRLESNFEKIGEPADRRNLDVVMQLAGRVGAEVAPKIDVSQFEFVSENRFFTEAGRWQEANEGNEGIRLDRSAQRFTIGSDGRVSRCEVIEVGQQGRPELERLCRSAIGIRFEPSKGKAERTGALVFLVYLRPSRDDPPAGPETN